MSKNQQKMAAKSEIVDVLETTDLSDDEKVQLLKEIIKEYYKKEN